MKLRGLILRNPLLKAERVPNDLHRHVRNPMGDGDCRDVRRLGARTGKLPPLSASTRDHVNLSERQLGEQGGAPETNTLMSATCMAPDAGWVGEMDSFQKLRESAFKNYAGLTGKRENGSGSTACKAPSGWKLGGLQD
eukprot:scaffold870_cov268-Pinguiococcus_pyrenoidosus.AAC.46